MIEKKKLFFKIGLGVIALGMLVVCVLHVIKLEKKAMAGERAAQYLDALVYLKAMPSLEEVQKAILKANESTSAAPETVE